jgi:hypothetical protein
MAATGAAAASLSRSARTLALRLMFALRILLNRDLSPVDLDKVLLFSSGRNSRGDRLQQNSLLVQTIGGISEATKA